MNQLDTSNNCGAIYNTDIDLAVKVMSYLQAVARIPC